MNQKRPDTAGEFARVVWDRDSVLPGDSILPKLRSVGLPQEFASSIRPFSGEFPDGGPNGTRWQLLWYWADYQTGAAGPKRPQILEELLQLELEYRRRAGESPTALEYERRLPEHLEIVRRAFSEQATLKPSPSDVNGPFATGVETPPMSIGRYIVLRRIGECRVELDQSECLIR